ncbi:MAG TPA: HAMP domain-containing sensor histidine kinase [Chryseolinea sp.]|nr:HAMP domain-containing sensor histidine kinase [Chryseolinea sp.]
MAISVNGKEFIALEEKKPTFHEILTDDLPPTSIKVNKADLEVESWNYSKGTLEIIVRKKLYNMVDVRVTTADKKPVSNLHVSFKGIQDINSTTNSAGDFQLPLALDEQIKSNDQFSIAGFKVIKIISTEKLKTLVVEPLKRTAPTPSFVKDFNLQQLDSIQSLTVFYAVFKNYDLSKLDPATKARIDAKFNELMGKLQQPDRQSIISKISDSSFVSNDVENLLEQAKLENVLMDNFRNDFDDKIKIINQKLAGGTSALNTSDRDKLFKDLGSLEEVLEQNEDKFYKNISDYRIILGSLKASFSDIKLLEDKLSISERKRMEEQQAFRNRIIIAGTVATVFGVLVIFLVLLRSRVEMQKKSLIKANAEIKSINENLEGLVFERSRLLVEAYQEMDIFLYRASHDLRAPICTIIGLCNLTLHSANNDRDLINKIANTAIKMDGMLKKLRMISEVNHPSNYSPVHVTQMIRDVSHFFNTLIADNNIEVIIDSDEDQLFYSYPDLLEIILYNLVENALFFSSMTKEHHPKIHIMASMEQDNLFLSVYDNGIGIDEEIKIKLWDMFFVGHERSKGNGLGLYIVLKSVQSLNGKIDVQTEPNTFTRFSISIPVNTKVSPALTRLGAPKEFAKALS